MLLPLGVNEVAVHVSVVPFLRAGAGGLIHTDQARRCQGAHLVTSVAGMALGSSILDHGPRRRRFTGILGICLAVRGRTASFGSSSSRSPAFVRRARRAAVVLKMEPRGAGYLDYYFIERHLQGYLTAARHSACGCGTTCRVFAAAPEIPVLVSWTPHAGGGSIDALVAEPGSRGPAVLTSADSHLGDLRAAALYRSGADVPAALGEPAWCRGR